MAEKSVRNMKTMYTRVATMRPFSNILDSCLKGPIRNIVLQASHQQSRLLAGISIDYEAHPSADAVFSGFHTGVRCSACQGSINPTSRQVLGLLTAYEYMIRREGRKCNLPADHQDVGERIQHCKLCRKEEEQR